MTTGLSMQIAEYIRPLILGLILCVSHSRTFSLIHGYSAPIEIYKHFEHHDDVGNGETYHYSICIAPHRMQNVVFPLKSFEIIDLLLTNG